MIISWERWEPNPEHSTDNRNAPEKSVVKAFNRALDCSLPGEMLLGILQYWFQTFPTACVLVTLTQDNRKELNEGNQQQLRFWIGEPYNFRSEHVDSMGCNLIVSVYGTPNELRRIVTGVLPLDEFEEGTQKSMKQARTMGVQDVITWRRKGVPPNSTGTVWEKEK